MTVRNPTYRPLIFILNVYIYLTDVNIANYTENIDSTSRYTYIKTKKVRLAIYKRFSVKVCISLKINKNTYVST